MKSNGYVVPNARGRGPEVLCSGLASCSLKFCNTTRQEYAPECNTIPSKLAMKITHAEPSYGTDRAQLSLKQ